MKIYRKLKKKAAVLAYTGFAGVLLFAYVSLMYAIPDRIYIHENGENIDLSLPVVLSEKTDESAKETTGNMETYQDGDASDIQVTSSSVTYTCKLFGIIPVKEVTAQIVDETYLLAGGIPVGIYVETDGVLVIGTGNVTSRGGDLTSPSENLVKSGDYIREVNGEAIDNKEELIEAVNQCEGKKVILKIMREGELIEVAIDPVQCSDDGYKIGLWVRDDLAGIGTLTYITEEGKYGALGHAVSDADTGTMLDLKNGLLYESNIVGIVKGENGTPGELTGVINYTSDSLLGDITKNTKAGIYGTLSSVPEAVAGQEAMPVGYKQEIRLGKAEIMCSVDGTIETYEISISEVNFHEDEEYKEILFEVTDKNLLEKTGGIVQGMSGSPIIQNGKIIGAVTHVFIQNAKKGYGIFIEDMFEND